MQQFAEGLVIEDGVPRVKLLGEPPFEPVDERSRKYCFELCRNQVNFGACSVDQFWMPLPGLYGTRNTEGENHKQLIDCYWSLCNRSITCLDPQQQDIYLLANLLPYTRNNGARRVFSDARLRKSSGKHNAQTREKQIAELDEYLRSHRDDELTVTEFRDRTGDFLGPPMLDEETQKAYDRLATELLAPGRELIRLRDPSAIQTVVDEWQAKMKSVGRRSGHSVEKKVLDILSYEARAAFHTCYSAVWQELLPPLTERYDLGPEAIHFHRFWHSDIRCPSEEALPADFHLFHGHISALHPASGDFLSTETGRSLVGEWLLEPCSRLKYQRMLNGVFVAVSHYYAQRNLISFERRKDSSGKILSLHESGDLQKEANGT